MGEEKSLYEKECECRYIPGLEAELNFKNDVRKMLNPNFIDAVLLTGDISKTDMFYLRAVAFYQTATAEMVIDFLDYFKNFYGFGECTNLLQRNVASEEMDPILYAEKHSADVLEVRRRLAWLSQKYLLFSYTTKKIVDGKEYVDAVFCVNNVTVDLVSRFFGVTPFFDKNPINYEGHYLVTPVQKMMEQMHAGICGVRGFLKHKDHAMISRGKTLMFGSNKERYTPTMYAKITCGEYKYRVVVEPIHFAYDEKIITQAEHMKNIEALIATMGRLINHYDYMEKRFLENPVKERIRFLIAVENLEGMQKIVRYMNKYCDKYSEKVFFTMDSVIREKRNLEDSIFMAIKRDGTDGEPHLALIKPMKSTLISTKNEWVFTNFE